MLNNPGMKHKIGSEDVSSSNVCNKHKKKDKKGRKKKTKNPHTQTPLSTGEENCYITVLTLGAKMQKKKKKPLH